MLLAGPVLIAPSILALQVLESNHLEWLHAGPEFTAFSRKDGSTSSSVESYANS